MLTQRSQHHKRVIAKHGVRIFVFPCDSEDQAMSDEIHQIAQLRREGYALVNRTAGGDGTSGYRHTDEAKAAMAKAAIGRPSAFKGRSHAETTKATASTAAKKQAQKLTQEERSARAAAASKAHWDRVPKEKRMVSAEVRAKISASRKGTPAWNKGISPSDEVRAKMSVSGKNKAMTPEHKAKIVAAQKNPVMRARQAAKKIGKTPWNKGIKKLSLSDPESSQEIATLSTTKLNATS